MFCFPISDNVLVPQRTVSFKCRLMHMHPHAFVCTINEKTKGKFPGEHRVVWIGKTKIYKLKRSIISGTRNRFSSYPYEKGDGRGERALIWGEPFFLLFWQGVGCLFQEGCTLIRACALIRANTVQCKFIRKLIKVWSSHLEIQSKLSAS